MKQQMKRCGEYEIINFIDKGSNGHVFLGQHITTKKKYAIKKIKISGYDQTTLTFLEREIATLRNLKHPNIVELIEAFKTEDFQYIVLELCENGNLEQYLQNQRLEETKAGPIIREIIKAMQYCNSQNVVHRDLKVANIMINSDNQMKIADFGHARFFEEVNILQSYKVGSPITTAPEILNKQPYTYKCDIWSIGVIMYQLLYGKYPYHPISQEISDLPEEIRTKPPAYPEDIPVSENLKNLIKLMLNDKPEIRINYEQISQHPWMQAPQDSDCTSSMNSIQMSFKSNQSIVCQKDQTAQTIAQIVSQNYNLLIQLIKQIKLIQTSNQNQKLQNLLEPLLQILSPKDIEIILKFDQVVLRLPISFVENNVNIDKNQDEKIDQAINIDYEIVDYYHQIYQCLLSVFNLYLDEQKEDRSQDFIKVIKLLWNFLNKDKFSNSLSIQITSQETLDYLESHLQDFIFKQLNQFGKQDSKQCESINTIDLKWNSNEYLHPGTELNLLKLMIDRHLQINQ